MCFWIEINITGFDFLAIKREDKIKLMQRKKKS